MARDIQMIKGQDKITVSENNLAHFESLGYKVVGKQEEVVKPKVIEKQKDNKEK